MEIQTTDLLPTKCSATGKSRYSNQKDAKEAILRIKGKKAMYDNISKKRYKRRQGKPSQCRTYYCKHCRGYHLTSMDTPLTQKKIERKFQQRIKYTGGLFMSKEEALSWKADGLPFPEK